MRTPLHAIFGFTSLAKLSVSDPEVMDYLDRVEHASRQLLEMIEKVLEASSLSDDDVNEVECNLKETVQDVYDFLQPQAAEKAIEFTLDFRALHRSAVYADRNKLRQLILYLVNNSVTYTNPGGRISIAVAEEPAHSNEYAQYCLTVSDTGAGMSEEYIKQVFEPFSREKNSTLSGVHGIGLGLTIAKSIVDMMHGTIRIDSVLGQGTTFTIMLTLRLQPEQERRRMDVVAEEGTQRLLLIEDNDLNREIEVELLEKLGFRIDAVKTGQAALKKLRAAAEGDYDLILTDLQMPIMDGYETASGIRALPNRAAVQLPIIALTAMPIPASAPRTTTPIDSSPIENTPIDSRPTEKNPLAISPTAKNPFALPLTLTCTSGFPNTFFSLLNSPLTNLDFFTTTTFCSETSPTTRQLSPPRTSSSKVIPKSSPIAASFSISGVVDPRSNFDTVCRVTPSRSPSSSCDQPRCFLSSANFSANVILSTSKAIYKTETRSAVGV